MNELANLFTDCKKVSIFDPIRSYSVVVCVDSCLHEGGGSI